MATKIENLALFVAKKKSLRISFLQKEALLALHSVKKFPANKLGIFFKGKTDRAVIRIFVNFFHLVITSKDGRPKHYLPIIQVTRKKISIDAFFCQIEALPAIAAGDMIIFYTLLKDGKAQTTFKIIDGS